MLYIISPNNRKIFTQELEDYFRLRKRVLIDQLGWDLKSIDGKEMDSFDHNQAHYLIYKAPETGQVAGGVRLTPSTAPNLTLDIFSNLIDPKKEFTPSNRIWESSRFVTKSVKGTAEKSMIREATLMLFIGMLEYGFHHNIHFFLTMTEVRLERIGRMVQWSLQRLGEVEKIGNTYAVVGLLEVSKRINLKMRENAGIFRNVFWDEGALLDNCLVKGAISKLGK